MGSRAVVFALSDGVAVAAIVALTCMNVLVGVTVFWFTTYRTGVSRHVGLMSPDLPD